MLSDLIKLDCFFEVLYLGAVKSELDEQVVRYLVVTTVAENTVYTKRAPVIKVETLVDNETDEMPGVVNIDTTANVDVAEVVALDPVAEAIVAETVILGTSAETK